VLKRVAVALALIAVLVFGPPVIHHALHVLIPARPVNRDGPAWKARVALIARAQVFVSPAPAPDPVDATADVECRVRAQSRLRAPRRSFSAACRMATSSR
jgi:hypothetical protein